MRRVAVVVLLIFFATDVERSTPGKGTFAGFYVQSDTTRKTV